MCSYISYILVASPLIQPSDRWRARNWGRVHNSWRQQTWIMSPSIAIKLVPPPISKEIGQGTFRSIIAISPFMSSKALQNWSVDVKRFTVQRTTQLFKVSVLFILILLHSVTKKIVWNFYYAPDIPDILQSSQKTPSPFFKFDCESIQGEGESGTGVRLIKGSLD